MKYEEPVVGIEPTTGALRMRYSTSELHRLIDYYKRVYYTLVAHLTLAIIPFAYSPCQAFFIPRQGFSQMLCNCFQGACGSLA